MRQNIEYLILKLLKKQIVVAEFYQKAGYKIIGVIPDANGFGKSDMLDKAF